MTPKRVADERNEKDVFFDRMFELEKRVRPRIKNGHSIANVNCELQDVIESVSGVYVERPYSEIMKRNWHNVYLALGIEADFSGLGKFDERDGLWAIIIPKGVTLNQLVEGSAKLFDGWWSLQRHDYADIISERSAKKSSYCVYVAAEKELREEQPWLSVNGMKNAGVSGITLEERIALGAWYFVNSSIFAPSQYRSGRHLDVESVCICAGSSDAKGRVPEVGYYLEHGIVDCFVIKEAGCDITKHESVRQVFLP